MIIGNRLGLEKLLRYIKKLARPVPSAEPSGESEPGVQIASSNDKYTFEFGVEPRGPASFGDDFIPQLQDIVGRLAVPGPASFLEWGSGVSTIVLSEIVADRGGQLVTIDENADYQQTVLQKVTSNANVQAYAMSLTGPKLSQADTELNYSTLPLSLGTTFDVILIDGRRRMECAWVAFMVSHENSIIVLHDYRRTRYQLILSLFDVLEDGSQFRVMKPKRDQYRSLAAERDLIFELYGGRLPDARG